MITMLVPGWLNNKEILGALALLPMWIFTITTTGFFFFLFLNFLFSIFIFFLTLRDGNLDWSQLSSKICGPNSASPWSQYVNADPAQNVCSLIFDMQYIDTN